MTPRYNIDSMFMSWRTQGLLPTDTLAKMASDLGKQAIPMTITSLPAIKDINQEIATCASRRLVLFYLLSCAKISCKCRLQLLDHSPAGALLLARLLNKFGILAAALINGDMAKQREFGVYNVCGLVRFLEVWMMVQ